MSAKAFLPNLPGLASFSFFSVLNYFCAALHTNTANVSELCGLRKFHYYIPCVVCQDVKMLSKISPKSALDEFHNKAVNLSLLLPIFCAFYTCTQRALFTFSCSSLVKTFKQAVSLLSSVTIKPPTVAVHAFFGSFITPFCSFSQFSEQDQDGLLQEHNCISHVLWWDSVLTETHWEKNYCAPSLRPGESLSSYPSWNWWAAEGCFPDISPG